MPRMRLLLVLVRQDGGNCLRDNDIQRHFPASNFLSSLSLPPHIALNLAQTTMRTALRKASLTNVWEYNLSICTGSHAPSSLGMPREPLGARHSWCSWN